VLVTALGSWGKPIPRGHYVYSDSFPRFVDFGVGWWVIIRWEYQATTEQLEEWHALALLLEAESPSIKDATNPLNATSLPSRAKRMGSGLLPGRSLGSTPLKAGKGQ